MACSHLHNQNKSYFCFDLNTTQNQSWYMRSPVDIPLRKLGPWGFCNAIICAICGTWLFSFIMSIMVCVLVDVSNPLIQYPYVVISYAVFGLGLISGVIAVKCKNKQILKLEGEDYERRKSVNFTSSPILNYPGSELV